MPKYTYKCTECEAQITVWHGMTEELTDCDLCSRTDTVHRVLTDISLQKQAHSPGAQPGSLVKKAIEETRQEIKLKREELENARSEN